VVSDKPYIYVASSWRNPRQPEIVAFIRSLGYEVYDFRNPEPGNTGFASYDVPSWNDPDPAVSRLALSEPVPCAAFELDFNALRRADALVMVNPCGRSAHLELGYACGRKPTIIMLEHGEKPELMYKLANCLVVDLEELEIALGTYVPLRVRA